MSFKDISYLELWRHFCLAGAETYNFGRSHHEEKLCEIILNLNQWFRRCPLKIFLIYKSGGSFVQWRGTICAILVAGTIRNNSVKLF